MLVRIYTLQKFIDNGIIRLARIMFKFFIFCCIWLPTWHAFIMGWWKRLKFLTYTMTDNICSASEVRTNAHLRSLCHWCQHQEDVHIIRSHQISKPICSTRSMRIMFCSPTVNIYGQSGQKNIFQIPNTGKQVKR
jgi:hypothetical protein